MTITRTEQALSARRRVELNRGVALRRLLRAVDAKRRLDAGGADLARTKADRRDPIDPRYAHLTRPPE